MGRTKPTDYSKLVIYKIRCNDESVLDFYIGSTTNFRSRKCAHKYCCKTDELKLYQMIRSNGGWENWTMVEVESYSCNSSIEARIREEYWRETLQSTMNQRRAYQSLTDVARNKIYRQENAEKVKAYSKQYDQEHREERRVKATIYREEHADKIKAKAVKYECECGTICCILHKKRHELTKKHQDFLIK